MSNSDSEESTCSGRSYRKSVIPSSAYRLSRLKNVGGTLEKPAELFRKDLISAMKLPDTECLFPEDYILISDPWRQDWEKGVQVPVNPEMEKHCQVDIIKENESMYGSYGFKMPKKLLHAVADDGYKQSVHELHETYKLAEEVCRYDLDHLDEVWLKSYNDIREQCGEEELSGWSMENIIEELETRCYGSLKAAEAAGMEFDEDTVCDICRMPDVEEGNEMVFCDGCDVGVHQACYGILKIPKGSWVCRTCAVGIKPRCALCTTVGGAMKCTKSGTQWAHLSCAIWIPEVTIEDPEKMEPISKIDLIPMTRLNLICSVCKERSGACVQCCEKKCKTAFHVTCAFKKNFKMKINCEEGELQFKAYCDVHSKNGSPLKSSSELTSEEKKTAEKSRLQAIREEFYTHVTCEEVAKVLGLDLETVSFVYEYWKLKRKSNFNKPLLAPKVDESASLGGHKEDGLVARLRMFIHLRQDLERVRNLCYMVIRRERTRNQLQQTKKELFLGQAEALDMEKLKPGSKEYETLRIVHKQNLSIYDRHAEIAKAANVYKTALDVKSKEESDDDDDDEAEESFLSAGTTSHSVRNNESSIKTPKIKDKSGFGTPSSTVKSPKGKKRPACDPTENPYARPTYKSFSWMLGTRKKRKLNNAQADVNSPVQVKPSASNPVCNLRSKNDVHEPPVVSAQSLGDVSKIFREEPKAGASLEESAAPRNANDTANQQTSPAKSSCLEEASFSLPNVMNHSDINVVAETPIDVSALDKNQLPEVKENINCLGSPGPRKIRSKTTHVKLGRPPKKPRPIKRSKEKEAVEPDDLMTDFTQVCGNFGFQPTSGVAGSDGVDVTSPELLSPPHSSSPDDNASNLLLESCDMQSIDNKKDDKEAIKTEPDSKKVVNSHPISPDVLCFDSSDEFVPDIEKIIKPSKKSSSVKGRNCKESDQKMTPINGVSKKTKDSQTKSRKSSVSGSILSPRRAKRSKDLGSNLVQSTLTDSPLFSNKSPSLKSLKVSDTSQVDLKKEGKCGADNSPEKLPINHTNRSSQKINDSDEWDDFVDSPKLTRPPLENGLSKSNKSSTKLAGKIFDKKNVTPILKSFQATLDSYLKSKDGEKSKVSPEKKTPSKSEETHRRPTIARENEGLIDPLKQVVLKLDRISNFKEKSSPQKFLQPPDKKTLKNSSNLPKRKVHPDSGKAKEPRQKYSTRGSSSSRN